MSRSKVLPVASDAVLPTHYSRFKFEPLHVDVENYGPGILIHKVNKYMNRADAKLGHRDLAKAARCLEMLRRYEMGDPDWWKSDRPAPLADAADSYFRTRDGAQRGE